MVTFTVEEMHVSVPMLNPNVHGEEMSLMSAMNNLVARSGATKEERARAVEWLYRKYASGEISPPPQWVESCSRCGHEVIKDSTTRICKGCESLELFCGCEKI
jgi:hypothetical protein